MNKRLPLIVILVVTVLICALAWYAWYGPVTTVMVVRHAERLNSSDTTSISAIGIQRAQKLAHVVSAADVKRIYVSEKLRTHQTAEPTSQAAGVSIIEIPAHEIARYRDSVKAHRGETILVVGHSDTVPAILAKLGVTSPPEIPSQEFDNLFVVSVFRFRSTMVKLKY